MGYTHYWTQTRDFTPQEMTKVVSAIQDIAKASGIPLGGWDGTGSPEFTTKTIGFNGKAWLDQRGNPTTEALRVTERFHRRDFGHMDLQITIDDPKAYTRPWTVMVPVTLQTGAGAQLLENVCENNRDLENLPGERLR